MINKQALEAIFKGSIKLKPQESCLIIADTEKESIGRDFFKFAQKITANAKLMIMQPTLEHGVEPPDDIAAQMLGYDVQFLITSKSLSHTKARRQATLNGARIASMPTVTEDIINRCCDIDYDLLKLNSQNLYQILQAASTLHVLTKLGTDIKFTIGKNKWFGENGGSFDFPGAFGNLPEGEVSFAPVDCNGQYVVDVSFPGLGILDSPITFKVRNGFAYEITGKGSEQIIKRLDSVGVKAYKIAELGIGLNPKAKVIGLVLEDEKVCGTIHIALGNNMSYGQDNDVPLHLDGVISAPNIYADGQLIMKNGKLIIG
ncbi:MAG: aminopeptidase [Candidatus Omnitrophica bacterium]|nr:aminopeptidase [Candidatus Omnitrophota bacterium]